MIVRIMGEGQFELGDEAVTGLNALDAELESAVEGDDEAAFARTLTKLLDEVRSLGTAVDVDELAASDLILPGADATISDVSAMLTDEGLIPG